MVLWTGDGNDPSDSAFVHFWNADVISDGDSNGVRARCIWCNSGDPVYTFRKEDNGVCIPRALVAAMICGGRIVWGMAEVVLLGVNGSAFGWKMFVSGAFLNAIPGILLQLILIPAIMSAVRRAGWEPEEKQEGEV